MGEDEGASSVPRRASAGERFGVGVFTSSGGLGEIRDGALLTHMMSYQSTQHQMKGTHRRECIECDVDRESRLGHLI